ncbi:hypothetical protein HPB47_005794 [Ixodes persulcatus]|uniref:Uncharacterized protein n=1 Tax=Ixodes persulcatus TaxID=34615 RepID=A0AC60PBZ0_IXOPE|nr:hypothetical protein HPB47_005794 [Ixodes persulcatus]
MYAYVRYADKQTSVLPVSLIQRFTPKHIEDFDPKKTKLAFWQDLDGGDGGYYDCRVVMLGEAYVIYMKEKNKNIQDSEIKTQGQVTNWDEILEAHNKDVRKNPAFEGGELHVPAGASADEIFPELDRAARLESSAGQLGHGRVVELDLFGHQVQNYRILGALWFGSSHPDMSLFMSKFVEEATSLDSLTWEHNSVNLLSKDDIEDGLLNAASQSDSIPDAVQTVAYCFEKTF